MNAKIYSSLHQFFLKKYHQKIRKVLSADKLNKVSKGMYVTEHALLRQAERNYGFNIQEALLELTSDNLAARVARLGDGIYSVGKNNVIVKNRSIVTVYPHEGRVNWRPLKKGDVA